MKWQLPPFETDLTRASTLPPQLYRDPEVFSAERERIFARTWQPVGNVADVAQPGSYVTCEAAGEPIVVVRGDDGQLRAFYNVCRHRAGPVAQGRGTRKSLTCLYHGWTYGLRGDLLTTPDFDGAQGFDKTCNGLVPVRVETFGPFVFVNLDDKAEALHAVLGSIPNETSKYSLDDYVPLAKRDYVIACNWKVYVDNYLEGYHLPLVHPQLFRELDYAKYRVDTARLHSSQYAPMRPQKTDAARRYKEEDGGALYYWVFPSWMLNIYPDNLSINVVVPLGVDRTLTIFEWFVRADQRPTTDIEQTMEFSHRVQLEDIAICEAVQKGMASRSYHGGRLSPRRENGVHHFQSLVHAWLTE